MERLTGKSIRPNEYMLTNSTQQTCRKAIDKLGVYEDAEEQGLLLRLPCKVGDKMYIVSNGSVKRVHEMEVLYINPFGAIYNDTGIDRVYNFYLDGNIYYKHCTFGDIGKTVFLTKEEAEQALANMKAGEENDARADQRDS